MNRLARWISAGCLLGAAACTALSDFSVHQCEVHADCSHLEGGAWQCQDSRCVPGCASNEHCSVTDPRTPICSQPGGDCVSLSSADGACFASTGFDPVAEASLTAKDMRIVGAFAPSVRSSTWLTLKLAADEINAAGGMSIGGGEQPLVVVLCQDSPSAVDAAMDHLVRDLGARAVVGSLGDEALRAAVERPASKGKTLFFSPNGADLASSNGDAVEQLLWYWGSPYDAAAPVYAPLLERLLEQSGQLFAPEGYRIAILRSTDREDEHLANAVASSLSVGGVAAADLLRFGQLRTFVLSSGSELPGDLVEFGPQLVLVFSGGHEPLSPYLERSRVVTALQALETGAPSFRPTYVLGPRSDDAWTAFTLGSNPEVRARTLLVSADRRIDPTLDAPVSARFEAAFPGVPADAVTLRATDPVYDVLYYLAFALDSLDPRTDSSASELRDSLGRISDATGQAAYVGPLDWAGTRAQRRTSSRFNLQGSSGPAAFDGQSQTRPGVAAVRCWNEQGYLVDRATYDVATGTLVAVRPSPCAGGAL